MENYRDQVISIGLRTFNEVSRLMKEKAIPRRQLQILADGTMVIGIGLRNQIDEMFDEEL